jgi:peptide deformylase
MASSIKYLFAVICSLGICTFSACSPAANFTKSELAIIHDNEANPVMRVLTIDSKADSLVLRNNSKDLKSIKGNKDLQQLLQRMEATMNAEEGIGIAAPQVGINRNIFLFVRIGEEKEKVQVAINPKIIRKSPERVCFVGDGCLSIPGVRGNSTRYPWIEVGYYDENGKYIQERFEGYERPKDFTGIIFQHEFDHIRGVLFIDKLCQ